MKVKTRSSLLIALIACWCFTSCNSQAQSPSTKSRAVQPVPAKMVKGKPEGLFYMQKMWIATRYLEKSCWYFAPDGKFYENLTSGFSAEELAAHKGSKGTYRVSQGNLEVTWSDGKSTKGPHRDCARWIQLGNGQLLTRRTIRRWKIDRGLLRRRHLVRRRWKICHRIEITPPRR